MDKPVKTPRSKSQPNPVRDYLEQDPPPMSKRAFAKALGVSGPYVSMLVADNPPWPSRALALRIAEVTNGAVDPNALAGWAG